MDKQLMIITGVLIALLIVSGVYAQTIDDTWEIRPRNAFKMYLDHDFWTYDSCFTRYNNLSYFVTVKYETVPGNDATDIYLNIEAVVLDEHTPLAFRVMRIYVLTADRNPGYSFIYCGFDGGRVIIGYSIIYVGEYYVFQGTERFLIVYNLNNLNLERIFTIAIQDAFISNIWVVKDYYFIEFTNFINFHERTYLALNKPDFSIVKTFASSTDNLLSAIGREGWDTTLEYTKYSYVYYDGGYNLVQTFVVNYYYPREWYGENFIIIYIDKYSDNFAYIGSEYYTIKAYMLESAYFHYDGVLRILMDVREYDEEYNRYSLGIIPLSRSEVHYLLVGVINNSILSLNVYTFSGYGIIIYNGLYYCDRWFFLLSGILPPTYDYYNIVLFEFNNTIRSIYVASSNVSFIDFLHIYDDMVHLKYSEYGESYLGYTVYEVREINLDASVSKTLKTTSSRLVNNAGLPYFTETVNRVMNSLTLSPIIEDKDVGLIGGSVAYYRTVNGYCCKIIQNVNNETTTEPPSTFTLEINVLNILSTNQMLLVLLFLLFFIPITRAFGVSRALSIASTVCAVVSLMVGAYNVFSMFLVLSILGFALWQSGY